LNGATNTVMNSRAAVRSTAAFVSRFRIAVLLLFSPFFIFPAMSRWPAFLIIPALLLARWIATGDPLPRTPFNASLALLLFMVLVSTFATYDLEFSLPKIAGLLFGVVLFFAIADIPRNGAVLWLALVLFCLAGVGLAGIGLLGTNWIGKFPMLEGITRHLPALIRGVPGQAEGFQPNAVGGALTMFLPLQLALAIGPRPAWAKPYGPMSEETYRKARLLLFPGFVFSASVLALTQSRGAWLGLGVAAILISMGMARRFQMVIVGAAATIGALVVILWSIGHPDAFMRIAGPGFRGDIAGRIELWSRAIYGIQDFAITGMGMNTFRRVMPVLYPTFLTSPDVDVAHAHNNLLQAALDLGIPGLVAYLAIWLGSARLLIGAYRWSDERGTRRYAAALAAGLVAYFVFGLGDAIALGAKVGIFFWVDLALIVVMYDVVRQDRGNPAE
jgi:putative inorganic carbon (HCO3(-)) transporter